MTAEPSDRLELLREALVAARTALDDAAAHLADLLAEERTRRDQAEVLDQPSKWNHVASQMRPSSDNLAGTS